MTIRKHTDRSRIEEANRCLRSRWWTYESGERGQGIVPVRKSIHLVLGSAVHAGLAVLLEESQKWLGRKTFWEGREVSDLAEKLDVFFVRSAESETASFAREVENFAVEQALADLAKSTEHGIELDLLEQAGTQQLQEIAQQQTAMQQGEKLDAAALGMDATGSSESAIEITFDAEMPSPAASDDWANVPQQALAQSPEDLTELAGLAGLSPEMQALLAKDLVLEQGDGMNEYLKLELAALVEAMVRAYARRRLRPLLEQYEVLEVEREGWWRLVSWSQCERCKRSAGYITNGACLDCVSDGSAALYEIYELYFMSRHDGLLRDRQTNSLYLLSYKTTGSWDRRKEMEAQIDQQGLSEAVDVERRMAEAWRLLQIVAEFANVKKDFSSANEVKNAALELVSPVTAQWLYTLSEPPQILGVRYEYLLKGARRQDKKDETLPGRYVADTPLVRAYAQDGITADDRRWAWTYDWFGLDGKSHRLDYRSWQKRAVWKLMPVAQWIDMLDKGEVQPDSYDKDGYGLDCLGEQFIPPILVYRNADDMRDWLEQVEASETRIAQNAEEVRQARREGGEAAERSALNRLFPQSRRSCIFPGVCSNYKLCYGVQSLRNDPVGSGHYAVRVPNHPVEMIQIDEVMRAGDASDNNTQP